MHIAKLRKKLKPSRSITIKTLKAKATAGRDRLSASPELKRLKSFIFQYKIVIAVITS